MKRKVIVYRRSQNFLDEGEDHSLELKRDFITKFYEFTGSAEMIFSHIIHALNRSIFLAFQSAWKKGGEKKYNFL